MDDTIVAAFAAALSGDDAVVTDATTLAENATDYWGFGRQPGLVLRPHTRDDIVAIVKVAAQHHVSLVTRGAASNCSAGVMAGSDPVVIDLTKMNQVLEIDPDARTARVQPGVINSDLQEQLAPHKNQTVVNRWQTARYTHGWPDSRAIVDPFALAAARLRLRRSRRSPDPNVAPARN